MHSIVTTFRGVGIKVEVANFCAAMDTLIDLEVANFCAAMDTLIDQDGSSLSQWIRMLDPRY